MHTGKRAYLYGFVVLFVLGMASLAEAGPMSIKVTNAEAGGMNGNKQAIVFWMTIKNTTSHEYIHKLNYAIVEVTGSWGNGRQEKYQRKVNVDWVFDPALGPGRSKNLKTRFMRNVNPGKGMYKYNSVRVRVLKYNFKRAS